jgi:hypothetical protein
MPPKKAASTNEKENGIDSPNHSQKNQKSLRKLGKKFDSREYLASVFKPSETQLGIFSCNFCQTDNKRKNLKRHILECVEHLQKLQKADKKKNLGLVEQHEKFVANVKKFKDQRKEFKSTTNQLTKYIEFVSICLRHGLSFL